MNSYNNKNCEQSETSCTFSRQSTIFEDNVLERQATIEEDKISTATKEELSYKESEENTKNFSSIIQNLSIDELIFESIVNKPTAKISPKHKSQKSFIIRNRSTNSITQKYPYSPRAIKPNPKKENFAKECEIVSADKEKQFQDQCLENNKNLQKSDTHSSSKIIFPKINIHKNDIFDLSTDQSEDLSDSKTSTNNHFGLIRNNTSNYLTVNGQKYKSLMFSKRPYKHSTITQNGKVRTCFGISKSMQDLSLGKSLQRSKVEQNMAKSAKFSVIKNDDNDNKKKSVHKKSGSSLDDDGMQRKWYESYEKNIPVSTRNSNDYNGFFDKNGSIYCLSESYNEACNNVFKEYSKVEDLYSECANIADLIQK